MHQRRVRTMVVEDASRFARDLVTQELGIFALIGRGVRVLTASGDDLTNTDDPFKVAMHQIAGLSPTRRGGRGTPGGDGGKAPHKPALWVGSQINFESRLSTHFWASSGDLNTEV